MSDIEPSPPSPAAEPMTPRRRPPRWGVVAFLVLLGGFIVFNYVASVGGPRITWVENDLDAALKQVSTKRPRLFLYLYEPNDPVHARNEREVFAKKWARDPLAKAVCCRIAHPNAQLARRYTYRGAPLFLVLDRSGQPTMGGRTEGAITEDEFYTYVTRPIEEAAKQPG